MPQLSHRSANLHASAIREILAVIERPGMISFAGGLPSADTFPVFDLNNIPAKYLQYGPSEGEPELRQEIAKQLQQIGLGCPPQQVLVLSGSQQGIDLVAKLFIDPGTKVAVESPTYLAALQVFRFYGADLINLDISQPKSAAALNYVIPTFQNPSAYCFSAEERSELARACDDSGSTLFEDDPYRDLMYEDCDRTPVCSLLKHSSWIYQGSFSKILAPGLRLGFLACSPDLIEALTHLKQAADLHSNRLSQWLVLQQIQHPDYALKQKKLVEVYKQKRNFFDKMLSKYLGKHAQWQIPQGGLFFWLQLKQSIDTDLLLQQAIKNNVAFMPGKAFFVLPQQADTFIRLNFSHATETEIDHGLKLLAELIENFT